MEENRVKKKFYFGNEETFSKEGEKKEEGDIEKEKINEYIHLDDSIKRIKEKIFMNCNLNVSISEMYLTAVVEKNIVPDIVYNRLTQNDDLDLTYMRLETFIKNVVKKEMGFLVEKDMSKIVKKKKDIYTYEEFLSLDYVDWEILNKVYIPIGQKVVINKLYDFIVNPFLCKEDSYLKNDIINYSTIQSRNLLFEYGNIVNNTLYLYVAESVLLQSESMNLSDDYLLKLYFPQLSLIHKVTSLRNLLNKKIELIENDVEFMKENNVEVYNKSINLLYDIHEKSKDKNLNYLNQGVKNIYLTIHPLSKINLPLEIIFKLIQSTNKIPLIKYNPGSRQENIYRLFTGKNIAENGKKIPILYVENNYKKGKIVKILANIEKKKRVTYIVNVTNKKEYIELYIHFLENGNIEIKINFDKLYKTIEEVENIIRDAINNDILVKINNFLEQSGYKYLYFNKINDENIEINDIVYITNVVNDKKINLKKISKCISSVFKIDTSIIKSVKDIISLDYKRVSNFNLMDSIDTYITIQRQKYNQNFQSIVEGLMMNFKLKKSKAEKKCAEWSENIQQEIDKYENKKFNILSSPGFKVIIKNTKLLKNSKIIPVTNIEVKNITHIKYIHFLKIFLDSLIRLSTNKESIGVSSEIVNNLCKVGEIKEIVEEKEAKAEIEKTLMDAVNDGDPISMTTQMKLDGIIGAEEEDWSSSDDDFENELEDELDEDLKKNVMSTIQLGDSMGESKKPSKKIILKKVEKSIEKKSTNDDDELLMDEDLSKFSISGNENIFLKRLRTYDPDLFLIEQKKGFKSYSKACPWQYRKYPVVLTDEEKKYIDEKDKDNSIKSYDEHITYGTGEKYHYICPRFWCFRDEEGKQRSLSFGQVNKGECGGWDALIPYNAKKITPGKRIFEFTDTRMHKDKVDTTNPLVYKPMYPGYQSRSTHPKGLCVPCCFSTPRTTVDENGDIWEKLNKKDKKTYTSGAAIWVNRNTGVEQKNPPKAKYYDYMYKGKPEPTFEKKDGKIVVESIKGKKWDRPLGKKGQISKWKDCNQEINIDKNENSKESNEISNEDAPLLETFPLSKNKLGYLTLGLQKFIGFNCRKICQISVTDTKLKDNTWCLMRIGIEKSKNQSFLGIIAFIYNIINKSKLNIKKIKQKMVEKLTLEIFVSLQNGNLIEVFRPKTDEEINKVKTEGVNTSSIVSVIKDEIQIKKIVGAYNNFSQYLLSKDEVIDHNYLWDYVCKENMFFERGLNMIILKSPQDDITNKINLLCPTNVYSNEIFNINKPSVIIYNSESFYEPVIRYKISNKKPFIKYLLNFKQLNKEAPELIRIMRVVKEKMLTGCKPLKSMPKLYNDKFDFLNNISSYEINKIIVNNSLNLVIEKQIINKNMKVIGLVIKDDKTKSVYVPTYPSSINFKLPYIYIETNESIKELVKSYSETIETLKNIYKISKKKILCNPVYKVVNENFIVGILTLTNQFVSVKPEKYQSPPQGWNNKKEQDGLMLLNLNTNYYKDYIKNETHASKKVDERMNVVRKIRLESNFFNVFRNTLRIVLNKSERKVDRKYLLNIVDNFKFSYTEKINKVKDKIIEIMKPLVIFEDLKLENINDIIKCFGLDELNCKEKKCCAFKDGNCKLKLPIKNMINEINNEKYYFEKVSDEIIRYKKIRDFFFNKESFLQFEKIQYNLDEDEVVLLEDLLVNKYFEDIKPMVKSKYIKSKNTYDMSIPNKMVAITDKYSFKLNCFMSESEKTSYFSLGEKWRALGLGRWNKGDGDGYTYLRIRETSTCLWEFLTLIIEDFTNNKITKEELINVIISAYDKYLKTDKKMVKDILKKDKKNALVEQMRDGIDLKLVLNVENYWPSVFDIFLVSRIFEIPIILFSSSKLSSIFTNTKVLGPLNNSFYYLIKMGGFRTNKMPFTAILKHKNKFKINVPYFEKAKVELFKNNNLINIKDYFDNFKKNNKKFKTVKTKGKLKFSKSKTTAK